MKKVRKNFLLDEKTVALLDALAEQMTEGNRSLTLRQLIREAAAERGIGLEAQEEVKA